MARKIHHTSTHTSLLMKAKDLKRGDQVHVMGATMHVKSNTKNDYGDRVVELESTTRRKHHRSTLIIPGKVKVRVSEHKFKLDKK